MQEAILVVWQLTEYTGYSHTNTFSMRMTLISVVRVDAPVVGKAYEDLP